MRSFVLLDDYIVINPYISQFFTELGGAGETGQGNDGADGFKGSEYHCNGGGGGAGAPGGGMGNCSVSSQELSNGGNGLLSNITGTPVWYAG